MPSEKVAIIEELLPKEQEEAKKRKAQAEGETQGVKKVSSENFSEEMPGESKAKVARKVGWSRPTFEKAQFIIEKARENPDAYGEFQEYMDKHDNVSGAHRMLKRKLDEERILAEVPLFPYQEPMNSSPLLQLRLMGGRLWMRKGRSG